MFGLFRRPTTLIEADHAAILIERERNRLKAEAVALDVERHSVLLDGSANEIACHDATRAKVDLALEQLDANEERLCADREEAAAADRVRRTKYEAALKRRAEGIAGSRAYAKAASIAAAGLRIMREVDREIEAVNRDLPAGAEPIPLSEPSTGFEPREGAWKEIEFETGRVDHKTNQPLAGPPYAMDHGLEYRSITKKEKVFQEGSPGREHISIVHKVRLPGLGHDPAYFP